MRKVRGAWSKGKGGVMVGTGRVRGGFWCAVVAMIVASLSISVYAPPSSATTVGSPSCGRTVVLRDFLAPLVKMPPVRRVPSSGKLPFGPAGLNLRSDGGLVVGPGSAGFSFSDEAIEQRRNLQWRVEAFLFRVSNTGNATSSPQATLSRRLGVVKDGNEIEGFYFDLPGIPAYYRVDLQIRALEDGRLLGRFAEYVRVMRPKVDLRVQVDEPTTVTRGETVHARLKNFGTVPVESASYVFGFNIWRHDGSRWRLVAENPPRGPVPKRMQILPAGAERRGCLRYRVPDDAPLGRYRFQAGDLVTGFEVASSPLRKRPMPF